MDRRGFLRNLGFGAGAMIPIAASAMPETKDSKPVGPMLLERTCDGGEAESDPKEWAEYMAYKKEEGHPIPWCGTKFQWYWGSMCICPNCCTHYQVMRKSIEKYRVK